jgi:cellulose synthase/poly-beta-1,6-N-acetylglucosamine synthase-like glycosyltransferase
VDVAEVAFWLSVAAFAYAYAGYPFVVWALSRLGPVQGRFDGSTAGRVTVVIAAYNEADVIADRVRNLLGLEGPQGGVEVIVASDGSTDGTTGAAAAVGDARVCVLDLSRGGRARAHNRAVASATGEIIAFTDARTTFDSACLRRLAEAFEDPGVGCVVGRLIYAPESGTVGDQTAAYWQFETSLRRWASDAGLLAVGTGCCMAVRKALFRELSPDEDVDDATPLDILLQGYRVVFVPEALASDEPPSTPINEIRARARMTVLSSTAVGRRARLLNPIRYPRAAFAVWSHRILRWLTPVWVAGVLGASIVLVGRPFYRVALMAQLLAYTLAFVGWVAGPRGARLALLRIPLGFVVWNAGFALGLVRVLRGKKVTAYAPIAAAPRFGRGDRLA